jgi:hypothetical protein
VLVLVLVLVWVCRWELSGASLVIEGMVRVECLCL